MRPFLLRLQSVRYRFTKYFDVAGAEMAAFVCFSSVFASFVKQHRLTTFPALHGAALTRSKARKKMPTFSNIVTVRNRIVRHTPSAPGSGSRDSSSSHQADIRSAKRFSGIAATKDRALFSRECGAHTPKCQWQIRDIPAPKSRK